LSVVSPPLKAPVAASSFSPPAPLAFRERLVRRVEFSAKHFGMMTVRGHFHEVTITGEIDPGLPPRTRPSRSGSRWLV
jgi:polyisoprenoid-binding protein YceI